MNVIFAVLDCLHRTDVPLHGQVKDIWQACYLKLTSSFWGRLNKAVANYYLGLLDVPAVALSKLYVASATQYTTLCSSIKTRTSRLAPKTKSSQAECCQAFQKLFILLIYTKKLCLIG